MICPLLSARRLGLAAVLLVSAIAVSACSSTGTGATGQPLQPLAKNAPGSLPISFNFVLVNAGANTAATGINDAKEIAGTYSSSSATNTVTQSFTSVYKNGQYSTFVGNNYPQTSYGAALDTSTGLVAINPGTTASAGTFEAGWVVNPGDFHGGKTSGGGTSVYNWTGGIANFGGLWTILHRYGAQEELKGPCVVMELQGINDQHEAVGFTENTISTKSKTCLDYPFLVKQGEDFHPIKLSSQSFSSAAATGIDKNGNIVGWGIESKTKTVGWYMSSTTGAVTLITVANSPVTQALGINGNGTAIVGSYADGAKTYGFLCIVTTTPQPCSSSADVQTGITGCDGCLDSYTSVSGVNDTNDISGYYIADTHDQRGFVGIAQGSKPLHHRAVQSHSPPR